MPQHAVVPCFATGTAKQKATDMSNQFIITTTTKLDITQQLSAVSNDFLLNNLACLIDFLLPAPQY